MCLSTQGTERLGNAWMDALPVSAVSHFVVSSKNSKVIWTWILWLIYDKWVITQKSLNISDSCSSHAKDTSLLATHTCI